MIKQARGDVKMRLLVVTTILVAAVGIMLGVDPTSGRGVVSSVSGLQSSDASIRARVASELREARQKTISELMAVAEAPSKPEELNSAKELSIDLLGEYRATEAIELLIKNIEYHVSSITFERVPAANYPCVRALAKIGVPSLHAIIRHLDNPCSEKELKLCANVFRLVDGDDVGVLRVEIALKKAEGQARKNLEQLIVLLKAERWYS